MVTYEVTVSDSCSTWQLDGKLHRLDGPAVEYADGSKEWYLYGKLHRENGPALEYANGNKCWYLDGNNVSEKEHARRVEVGW